MKNLKHGFARLADDIEHGTPHEREVQEALRQSTIKESLMVPKSDADALRDLIADSERNTKRLGELIETANDAIRLISNMRAGMELVRAQKEANNA